MSKTLSYVGLVLAVLLWGVSFISVAIILEQLSVSELNIVRFVLANGVLWLIQLIRPVKMSFRPKDLPLIILAGVLGTAGYYYFEHLGLVMVGADLVSLVSGSIPIITLVIAILLFKKKTKFKNIFLVLISFGGMALLIQPGLQTSSSDAIGIGLVMVANIFWVLYTLFNETLNKKYDILQLLTLQYTAGMTAFIGFYLYELSTNPTLKMLTLNRISEESNVLGHLIFVSIFVSVGAYFLYNYALAHLGVMISALFINVVPVVTLIVSIAVGLEVLTFNRVAGCLLVVIAIFFIDDI